MGSHNVVLYFYDALKIYVDHVEEFQKRIEPKYLSEDMNEINILVLKGIIEDISGNSVDNDLLLRELYIKNIFDPENHSLRLKYVCEGCGEASYIDLSVTSNKYGKDFESNREDEENFIFNFEDTINISCHCSQHGIRDIEDLVNKSFLMLKVSDVVLKLLGED